MVSLAANAEPRTGSSQFLGCARNCYDQFEAKSDSNGLAQCINDNCKESKNRDDDDAGDCVWDCVFGWDLEADDVLKCANDNCGISTPQNPECAHFCFDFFLNHTTPEELLDCYEDYCDKEDDTW